MRAFDVQDARERAWRLNIQDFAEGMSGGEWQCFPWLDVMLSSVQDAIMQGNARLILNAPPRHGKSEAISHWLPTWFLDWFPRRHVILASYSDTYAKRWGLVVRDEFLPGKFTWVRVRPDKSAANDWQLVDGGSMRSVGVGGSITGQGGDLIVVDDPHKNWEEAMSPTARQKVVDWFEGTIWPRREPGASVVLVQTRWHEEDLTGYLLREKTEDAWTLMRFPALAEQAGDMLGRSEGEPLCPERFKAAELAEIRRTMGTFKFDGQYQQHPSPLGSGMVKRDWFGRWSSGTLPPGVRDIISLDPTNKKTGTSYVVAQVWRQDGPNYYLLDQIRDRMSFLECVRRVADLKLAYPSVSEILVEEAANGPAIIDTLKTALSGVLAIRAETSKENRLLAVSGTIEAGNVFLPAEADWVDGFVEEVVTFPGAANDDQVDAMTMALARLTRVARPDSFDFEIPIAGGTRVNAWKEMTG